MINLENLKKYCCEDIAKIENYAKAINDKTQVWVVHHRLGNKLSIKCLKENDLYYHRPADELIFLTKHNHMKLHMSNKPKSSAQKVKMAEAKLGKKHSEEHNRKISQSKKNQERKQILQISDFGDFIAMYRSSYYAQKITGINRYSILQACKGKTHTAGGYKWKFVD